MFQRVDPPRRVSYVGDEIVVRVTNAQGRAEPGVEVRVRLPSGGVQRAGVADAKGEVRFVSAMPGPHEFRGRFRDELVVIAIHDVVSPPLRWLYAIVLVPLGLLFVVWNFRKLRAERASQDP